MATTSGIDQLGHAGLWVHDLARMREFYAGMLGLTVTDEDEELGIVFLSSRPDEEHHELVLQRGRVGGPDTRVVHQSSWRLGSAAALREFHRRLSAFAVPVQQRVMHGTRSASTSSTRRATATRSTGPPAGMCRSRSARALTFCSRSMSCSASRTAASRTELRATSRRSRPSRPGSTPDHALTAPAPQEGTHASHPDHRLRVVTAATAAASAAAGPRPAAASAAAAAYTPIGTCEQVVHHPSPSVDHPMHRSVISLHPDGTVIDSSPTASPPGAGGQPRSSFELIIDEYQYDDVDLTLQVVRTAPRRSWTRTGGPVPAPRR